MATWTNQSKNSASYTNQSKNSASFTNVSKNSASYTNVAKTSSSYTNVAKSDYSTTSAITTGEAMGLLLALTYASDIGGSSGYTITYTNLTKN
jgi:hypothetical protein